MEIENRYIWLGLLMLLVIGLSYDQGFFSGEDMYQIGPKVTRASVSFNADYTEVTFSPEKTNGYGFIGEGDSATWDFSGKIYKVSDILKETCLGLPFTNNDACRYGYWSDDVVMCEECWIAPNKAFGEWDLDVIKSSYAFITDDVGYKPDGVYIGMDGTHGIFRMFGASGWKDEYRGASVSTIVLKKPSKIMVSLKSGTSDGLSRSFFTVPVEIENRGDKTETVVVEVGIIPVGVCNSWFGTSYTLQQGMPYGYSECCPGQENIEDDNVYNLMVGEKRTVNIIVTVPYEGIKDKCGSTEYWVPIFEGANSMKYMLYATVSNKCGFLGGVKQDGFELYDTSFESFWVSEPLDVECSLDSDCGTDGYIGDKYCCNGDVCQMYRTYSCEYAGSSRAVCEHDDAEIVIEECSYGCEDAACKEREKASGFDISLERGDHSGDAGSWYHATVTVKNTGDISQKALVEVGIIPTNLRWFSQVMFSGFENYFDCCSGQENIEGAWVNLDVGDSTTFQMPMRVPYDEIEDKCGSTEYWDGYGDEYIVYAIVSNKCHYLNGIEQANFVEYGKDTMVFDVLEEAAITCSSNSDCGDDGFIETPYCCNDNLCHEYRTYTCQNKGLITSFCDHDDKERTVEICEHGCEDGECKGKEIVECTSSRECQDKYKSCSYICEEGECKTVFMPISGFRPKVCPDGTMIEWAGYPVCDYPACPGVVPPPKKYCGDGICSMEIGENYDKCPEDCPKSEPMPSWFQIVAVVVFLGIIGFVFYMKREQ